MDLNAEEFKLVLYHIKIKKKIIFLSESFEFSHKMTSRCISFLLPLHSYNFAAVTNHNVDTCGLEGLRIPPWKGHLAPKVSRSIG